MGGISISSNIVTSDYTPIFTYLPGTLDAVSCSLANYTIINNVCNFRFNIDFDNSSLGFANEFVLISTPPTLIKVANTLTGAINRQDYYPDILSIIINDGLSNTIRLGFTDLLPTATFSLLITGSFKFTK